jgi:photosystem II stability/assembly factor-like uncharacterized protein
MSTLLLAGTKKGLFVFTSDDRRSWQMRGPFLPGKEVSHAMFDPRTRQIFATGNDSWFGCEIMRSPDLGDTWTGAELNPAFTENSGLKLERIWHLESGLPSEPNVLYAGVAPAALFRTTDGGKTWHEVTGLTAHSTRKDWHPGAGGLCLHSIVVDERQPRRLFVAISAVGVFRSDDGGATWTTANRGTRAEFIPGDDKYPDHGQCVHKLLLNADGKILFQQNHCGVYRSEDAGANWTEITKGLPSDFGFPLALHPRDPKTLYVLPLKGGEFRCPPDNRLRVFRSRDAGATWQALSKGLPEGDCFASSLREGMASDTGTPAGIYFGTNTGKIFGSIDEGDSWSLVADNLPPIYSVATGQL